MSSIFEAFSNSLEFSEFAFKKNSSLEFRILTENPISHQGLLFLAPKIPFSRLDSEFQAWTYPNSFEGANHPSFDIKEELNKRIHF